MSAHIFRATLFVAIAFGLCGTIGVQKTEAEASNYFVDLTGNGCGSNCADFQNFLTANGITTSTTAGGNTANTNTNVGTPTGTATGQTGTSTAASPYPYQIYTNFASTDAYYQKVADYNKSFVNTPPQTYSYYQDPSAKPDSAASGQYPEKFYVYYGSDASAQMSKYNKTYKATSSYAAGNAAGTQAANGSNGGFTITSIK